MRRRSSLFIDADGGVDRDANDDERINDNNDDWNEFVVAQNVEFKFEYYIL